jgi:hypothetical protein
MEDPRIVMETPAQKMKNPLRNQPHTNPLAPDSKPVPIVDVILGTKPMILKAIPKTCNVE